jgi:hypothetical protein
MSVWREEPAEAAMLRIEKEAELEALRLKEAAETQRRMLAEKEETARVKAKAIGSGRLMFAAGMSVAVGVIAAHGIKAWAETRPERSCIEYARSSSPFFNVSCDHRKHRLVREGFDWVCKCSVSDADGGI